MRINLKIGDLIRDIEDGDLYYEGVVTSIDYNVLVSPRSKGCETPVDNFHNFEYRVTKVVCGEELVDDELIGEIITRRWWILEVIKSVSEFREEKLNQLLNEN